MIAYLLAGVAILAMVSGLAYKTYEAGADKVRTEWAAATLKAKSEAEAERQRQEALRQQQDKDYTRRVNDAQKRARTLQTSLDAHIRVANLPRECRIPDSLRDIANRALAGTESLPPGGVPGEPKPAPPAR